MMENGELVGGGVPEKLAVVCHAISLQELGKSVRSLW